MASRLIVLVAALAASQASPYWIAGNPYVQTILLREARAPYFEPPSIAYGYGSGFSSNIGGVQYSSGIGASFKTGNAEAIGSGSGSSDGNVRASGIGYAKANPSPPSPYVFRYAYPNSYIGRNYGNANAISSAQNSGNLGSAVAQAHNGPQGTAFSAAQNLRGLDSGSTFSAATSHGNGGAAFSSSDSYGNAISLAQSPQGSNAVSAAHNYGGVRSSIAQTFQQGRDNGGGAQHSSAFSINAPGIQTAQSHAVNNGGASFY